MFWNRYDPFFRLLWLLMFFSLGCTPVTSCGGKKVVRIASFNVSMESTNYGDADPEGLIRILQGPGHPQVRNIAEILQRVRPDIVLLNEFDFISDPELGVKAFIRKYLNVSQGEEKPIQYDYFYYAPVNTGQLFPVDLNRDGDITLPDDAYGWGRYPGHYGMLVLSRFPIQVSQVLSFKHFLWKDMPDALLPVDEQGRPFYSREQLEHFRLSSKSHWDIPIQIHDATLHVLASHPTPPVFDGPEDRNGRRNFDELRLWKDYLDGASYLYNDQGRDSRLNHKSYFVVAGDLNASDTEGESYEGAIQQLLAHPLIQDPKPESGGAAALWPGEQHKHRATHYSGLRLDYVLPSRNIKVLNKGVYWPDETSEHADLVKDRASSSDHRLVWVDVSL